MKSKTCTWCHESKSITEFHRVKAGESKRAAHCKKCDNERKTKWHRERSRKAGKRERTLTLVARELRSRGLKRCPGCKEDKKLDQFYTSKASRDGYASHCILCQNADSKKFPKLPRTSSEKKLDRHKYLTRRYGVTLKQYNLMFVQQNGCCAICGGKDKGKTLAVDHCHETGKVRGLLCGSCNPGLGFLKDSIPLLQKAIEYLKKHLE